MAISLALFVFASICCLESHSFEEHAPDQVTSVEDPLTCIGAWLTPSNGTCVCGDSVGQTVACDRDTGELEVLICYCMTPDSENHGATVVGACLYNCREEPSFGESYVPAPTNCSGQHRTGTLCGDCDRENHAFPRAYSYDMDCVVCPHPDSWFQYLAVALVPLTVFIVIVIVCRISVLSPKLRLFVFFSQVFSMPINVRPFMLATKYSSPQNALFIKVYMAILGVWNLDFFRTLYPGVCLHLNELHVLALDYMVAVYPMLLMIIAYVLVELHGCGFKPVLVIWKPFHYVFARFRRKWNIQTSIIDAFATFFVLSTTKLFSVSFDLLIPTVIHVASGDTIRHKIRLYYNANIIYMGRQHLPFALLAFAVFSLFVLFPLLLLIVSSCSNCLSNRGWRVLDEFLYSFQKYYKDGSNGSVNHKWYSCLYILVFLTIYLVYTTAEAGFTYYFSSTILIVFAAVVIVAEPYKEEYDIYNKLDCIQFLWIALVCVFLRGICTVKTFQPVYLQFFYVVFFFVFVVPLVYLLGVVLHWIWKRKQRQCYCKCLKVDMEVSLPHRLTCSHEYKQQE